MSLQLMIANLLKRKIMRSRSSPAGYSVIVNIDWIWPPPRIPVGNEGFVGDPLLKM